MQSKDIILQVSEETAEVMEEISEQLFDESEARFDEIVEAIGDSIKKIEKLYSDFTGYAGKTDTTLSSNQTDVLNRFGDVLDALSDFKKYASEQSIKIEEKNDRLIEIVADVSQLIQAVSKIISESSETAKEVETTLLQAVNGLVENLMQIQKIQADIVDKLNSDDSREKLTFTLNKLSEIEQEIQQTKDTLGNVSDTLHNGNTLIEQMLSSVKGLQENEERILVASRKNDDKVDELGKQSQESSKLLLEKVGDVLTCLETLSHTIKAVADKQAELEKYLKLPFFKR